MLMNLAADPKYLVKTQRDPSMCRKLLTRVFGVRAAHCCSRTHWNALGEIGLIPFLALSSDQNGEIKFRYYERAKKFEKISDLF